MLRPTIALILLTLLTLGVSAAIPLEINHQGVITVTGVPYDGPGLFRFALVDPDSGNNAWTNDGTNVGSSTMPTAVVTLTVTGGVYSVRLGDTALTNMTTILSSVFDDDNIQLRVWFDDGLNGVQQLAPDTVLTSAPYAFHAVRAELADFATVAATATTATTASDADTVDGVEAAALEESAEIISAIGGVTYSTVSGNDGATGVTGTELEELSDGSSTSLHTHVTSSSTPTGSVLMWSGTMGSVPGDWLLCDGSAVSRTTYADLFVLIGTTYGIGDGSTTFNVPDLRGRFPLGMDNMGGSSANRVTNVQADSLGGSQGTESHALAEAELASHSHFQSMGRGDSPTFGTTVRAVIPDPGGGGSSVYGLMSETTGGHDDTNTVDVTTETAGSGTAHENMPPYLALNYIIKI